MSDCPVCGGRPEISIRRISLPIFQNVTYATANEGRIAPTGSFALGTCATCGFSYNSAFDPTLVTYDENYDNHVSSAAFADYYRSLAEMLVARLDLDGGTVVDVGCGKGEFLKSLCAIAPGIKGLGIDPSCQPGQVGNVTMLRAHFDGDAFPVDTRLVICRHVVEHISEPVDFLSMLARSMPDVPLFVEVPDLDWILRNGAFWDFCYEHCNYFSVPTLRAALERSGFKVIDQQRSFGDQYQWAVCQLGDPTKAVADAMMALKAVRDYARNEDAKVEKLSRSAEIAGGVALWGMATKGVILAGMLPPNLIAGGIDSNPAKQGRFAAGTGTPIHPPGWLKKKQTRSVLIMNPNYEAEIRKMIQDLEVDIAVTTV